MNLIKNIALLSTLASTFSMSTAGNCGSTKKDINEKKEAEQTKTVDKKKRQNGLCGNADDSVVHPDNKEIVIKDKTVTNNQVKYAIALFERFNIYNKQEISVSMENFNEIIIMEDNMNKEHCFLHFYDLARFLELSIALIDHKTEWNAVRSYLRQKKKLENVNLQSEDLITIMTEIWNKIDQNNKTNNETQKDKIKKCLDYLDQQIKYNIEIIGNTICQSPFQDIIENPEQVNKYLDYFRDIAKMKFFFSPNNNPPVLTDLKDISNENFKRIQQMTVMEAIKLEHDTNLRLLMNDNKLCNYAIDEKDYADFQANHGKNIQILNISNYLTEIDIDPNNQ